MNDVEKQGLLMLGMATAYLRSAGWEIEQISDFVLQGYDYAQSKMDEHNQRQRADQCDS